MIHDIDEGFKAVLDSLTTDRMETIDTPADVEKCIVSHLDANANSNVYYTVEDGQIVKHVDTYVEYSAEATTVIYTKVELASGSASSVLGDVNGDGDVSVNDVAMIVNYILGITDSNFIIANADINGDGEIDINDVMGTVNIILEGDNTPQAYLTCPDNNHPHAIDLGLPSGTKWACCNVDAEKPESYGGYYAWGEVTEKNTYNWSNYVHCDGSSGTCHFIGNDIAGTEFDVAHVKWGGKWQMPNKEQIKELLDNCTREWIEINESCGVKFTGPNGGSIFFPAASGYWDDSSTNIGRYGYYWTSTLDTSNVHRACSFDFYSGNAYTTNSRRLDGCTIRPIWAP